MSIWSVVSTYPSEKYEFVSWDDYSQYIMFETTNQVLVFRRSCGSSWFTMPLDPASRGSKASSAQTVFPIMAVCPHWETFTLSMSWPWTVGKTSAHHLGHVGF